MAQRTVKNVKIVDIQKRKVPSKHYVYVINVTWSDGSVNGIYRRYSKFFDLQTKLLEEFPEESGVKNPTKRILPFLPGKIIFGRSHVRDVALRRMEPINDYCKDLISLPAKISNCLTVLKFFEPLPEDIELPALEKERKKKERDPVEQISVPVQLERYVAIADYKKQNRNEVSMVAGDLAEVIDKNENGWWFVNVDEEQGWVPAAYLESEDGDFDESLHQPVTSEEQFITTSAYKAELDDEISFEVGVIVTLLEKNFDGWWLVRYRDREGWAPAVYLRKADPCQLQAVKHGPPSLKRNEVASRAASPAASKPSQALQLKKEDKPDTKNGRLPPRKNSVKRSIKKLPIHIVNMSYEQTILGSTPSVIAPEVEYFTVGDFRSLGIEGTLDFAEGSSVEVVDKAPNGWWLGRIAGKEGWIPSSYLGKREKQTVAVNGVGSQNQHPAEPDHMESKLSASFTKAREKVPLRLPAVSEQKSEGKLVTLADYEDNSETSVSFKEGEIAELIQKDEGGWSFVRIQGKEGWAPSSYLAAKKEQKTTAPPKPRPPAATTIPGKPKIRPAQVEKSADNVQGLSSKSLPTVPKPRHENSTNILLPQNGISKKPDPPSRPQVNPRWKPDPSTKPQVNPRSKPALPVKPVLPKSAESQTFCAALASFVPDGSEGLTFTKGEEFEYLEDSGSGWWLVRRKDGLEGWAPASYLESVFKKPKGPVVPPKPTPPKGVIKDSKPPVYIAVASYADEDGEDFVSFQVGDRMEVLEMDDGGWWLVKLAGKSGWAPSNYLKPC